jgi:hypothetical protein
MRADSDGTPLQHGPVDLAAVSSTFKELEYLEIGDMLDHL